MQLVIYCKKCLKRNALRIWATNRVDIKMKHGNNIEIVCKRCKSKNKYHIDDIQAEQRFVMLISFIALILCIILLVSFLWGYNWHKSGSVFLIPVGLLILVSIFIALNKEMNKRVRNFNKS